MRDLIPIRPKPALCIGLALLHFTVQVTLAHQMETSFWEERHARLEQGAVHSVARLARLPERTHPGLTNTLFPPVGTLAPSLPAEQPKDSLNSTDLEKLAAAIPLHLGTVQEVYEAPFSREKPVVLVQDVHLNAEAQTNIAGILQGLIDRNLIGGIGTEGAFAPIDLQRFRSLPKPDVTKFVADSFLEHNKLAAPSYVGVTSAVEPPPLIGVDSWTHYQKNVAAYLEGRRRQNRTFDRLDRLEKNLKHEMETKLTPDLRTFDALRTDAKKGEIDFGAYLDQLASLHPPSDLAIAQFLEAYRMETRLDFKKVEIERRRILEQLVDSLSEKEINQMAADSLAYRNGHMGFGLYHQSLRSLLRKKNISLNSAPHFDSYLRYVLLSDGIKPAVLFERLEDWENEIVAAHAETPAHTSLLNRSRLLNLARKLVSFSLTAQEWEVYEALKGIQPSELTRSLDLFEEFYRQADNRSAAMLNKITGSFPSKARVLVSGGFHTQEFTKELRLRGVPYLVISPKLTKIDGFDGSAYLGAFAREKSPLEALFRGEKLFINPQFVTLGNPPAAAAFAASQLTRSTGNKIISLEWPDLNDPIGISISQGGVPAEDRYTPVRPSGLKRLSGNTVATWRWTVKLISALFALKTPDARLNVMIEKKTSSAAINSISWWLESLIVLALFEGFSWMMPQIHAALAANALFAILHFGGIYVQPQSRVDPIFKRFASWQTFRGLKNRAETWTKLFLLGVLFHGPYFLARMTTDLQIVSAGAFFLAPVLHWAYNPILHVDFLNIFKSRVRTIDRLEPEMQPKLNSFLKALETYSHALAMGQLTDEAETMLRVAKRIDRRLWIRLTFLHWTLRWHRLSIFHLVGSVFRGLQSLASKSKYEILSLVFERWITRIEILASELHLSRVQRQTTAVRNHLLPYGYYMDVSVEVDENNRIFHQFPIYKIGYAEQFDGRDRKTVYLEIDQANSTRHTKNLYGHSRSEGTVVVLRNNIELLIINKILPLASGVSADVPDQLGDPIAELIRRDLVRLFPSDHDIKNLADLADYLAVRRIHLQRLQIMTTTPGAPAAIDSDNVPLVLKGTPVPGLSALDVAPGGSDYTAFLKSLKPQNQASDTKGTIEEILRIDQVISQMLREKPILPLVEKLTDVLSREWAKIHELAHEMDYEWDTKSEQTAQETQFIFTSVPSIDLAINIHRFLAMKNGNPYFDALNSLLGRLLGADPLFPQNSELIGQGLDFVGAAYRRAARLPILIENKLLTSTYPDLENGSRPPYMNASQYLIRRDIYLDHSRAPLPLDEDFLKPTAIMSAAHTEVPYLEAHGEFQGFVMYMKSQEYPVAQPWISRSLPEEKETPYDIIRHYTRAQDSEFSSIVVLLKKLGWDPDLPANKSLISWFVERFQLQSHRVLAAIDQHGFDLNSRILISLLDNAKTAPLEAMELFKLHLDRNDFPLDGRSSDRNQFFVALKNLSYGFQLELPNALKRLTATSRQIHLHLNNFNHFLLVSRMAELSNGFSDAFSLLLYRLETKVTAGNIFLHLEFDSDRLAELIAEKLGAPRESTLRSIGLSLPIWTHVMAFFVWAISWLDSTQIPDKWWVAKERVQKSRMAKWVGDLILAPVGENPLTTGIMGLGVYVAVETVKQNIFLATAFMVGSTIVGFAFTYVIFPRLHNNRTMADYSLRKNLSLRLLVLAMVDYALILTLWLGVNPSNHIVLYFLLPPLSTGYHFLNNFLALVAQSHPGPVREIGAYLPSYFGKVSLSMASSTSPSFTDPQSGPDVQDVRVLTRDQVVDLLETPDLKLDIGNLQPWINSEDESRRFAGLLTKIGESTKNLVRQDVFVPFLNPDDQKLAQKELNAIVSQLPQGGGNSEPRIMAVAPTAMHGHLLKKLSRRKGVRVSLMDPDTVSRLSEFRTQIDDDVWETAMFHFLAPNGNNLPEGFFDLPMSETEKSRFRLYATAFIGKTARLMALEFSPTAASDLATLTKLILKQA